MSTNLIRFHSLAVVVILAFTLSDKVKAQQDEDYNDSGASECTIYTDDELGNDALGMMMKKDIVLPEIPTEDDFGTSDCTIYTDDELGNDALGMMMKKDIVLPEIPTAEELGNDDFGMMKKKDIVLPEMTAGSAFCNNTTQLNQNDEDTDNTEEQCQKNYFPSKCLKPEVDKRKLWPCGKIPYTITGVDIDSVVELALRKNVFIAMDQFRVHTVVRFVPKPPGNTKDYLEIKLVNTNECFSNAVGRKGGLQIVKLGRFCNLGVIMHELMHVLGFFHQQVSTYPNRDDYITIDEDNIEPGKKGNFNKKNNFDLGYGYDFNSLMHYGAYMYALDKSKPVIVPLPNVKAPEEFGNVYFSKIDIKKINKLYGVLGSCVCKIGDKECGACKDTNRICQVTDKTKCVAEKLTECPLRCDVCTKDNLCKDELDYCKELQKQQKYCDTTPAGAVKYCLKTCGYCKD